MQLSSEPCISSHNYNEMISSYFSELTPRTFLAMSVINGAFSRYGNFLSTSTDFVRPLGFNVLNPKFTCKTTKFVLSISFLIFQIITVCFSICRSKDFIEMATNLTTIGFFVQGSTKLFIYIYFRNWILEMPQLVHETYNRNRDNLKLVQILDFHAELCWKVLQALTIFDVFLSGLFVVPPLLFRCFSEERVLTFKIIILFSNPSKSPGFELNYLNHLLLCSYACLIYLATDTYIINLMIMARAQVKALIGLLEELDQYLVCKRTNYEHNGIHQRLITIVREHQFHIE